MAQAIRSEDMIIGIPQEEETGTWCADFRTNSEARQRRAPGRRQVIRELHSLVRLSAPADQ